MNRKYCAIFLYILHPKKSCSSLKVVSATFFQIHLACLTESTCEIRKNVFYFAKFSGTQMSWRHQMPEHEARNTFYWITWEVTQSGNEIWPAYVTFQNEIFYQKILRKVWPGSSFHALSNFQRILCKKEFEEASMLIWTNFDSFAITYLI